MWRAVKLGYQPHEDILQEAFKPDSYTDAERHTLLVNTIRDYAIYMLDRDGRVSSWNAGAQRVNRGTRSARGFNRGTRSARGRRGKSYRGFSRAT